MYIFNVTCPKVAIIQHLPSGDYDYSEHGSIEMAWHEEQEQPWVSDYKVQLLQTTGIIDEEILAAYAKRDFTSTLAEYNQDQILQAAMDGYAWPEYFGFVKYVELDT